MNRFTEQIHDKGFIIREFCEYWEISKRTYERMTANPDKHSKLNKMINGLNSNKDMASFFDMVIKQQVTTKGSQ